MMSKNMEKYIQTNKYCEYKRSRLQVIIMEHIYNTAIKEAKWAHFDTKPLILKFCDTYKECTFTTINRIGLSRVSMNVNM